MNLPVDTPWNFYTFDHRLADCSKCALKDRRDETICLSQKPEPQRFNGLMLLGEGPGVNEARLKVPFCLVPETPVLMADLTWKALGDVVVGDQILTMEEQAPPRATGASKHDVRRWLIATVTRTVRRRSECWEVQTEDGVLMGSGDHRVLTSRGARGGQAGVWHWTRLDRLHAPERSTQRRSRIAHIGGTWAQDRSFEAGWLSGFFDGEGHVGGSHGGQGPKRGIVGFSQNIGTTQERALAYLQHFGFGVYLHSEGRKNGIVCARSHIRGGFLESMRFLGLTRPQRLVDDFVRVLQEAPKASRASRSSAVLSRHRVGMRDVVDITTTAGTFVANGFVVHNCGRAGGLLDALLKKVGIEREECYVGNATLCCPPVTSDKEKAKIIESAVAACHSRLSLEIEHLQPRVIIAFGGPALSALTGRFIKKTKKVPRFQDANGGKLNCPKCDGEMTLAWWKCPTCKHENLLPPRWDQWMGQTLQGQFWCSGEHACLHNNVDVQKRKKRCPTCLGRKTIEAEIEFWKTEHKISAVSGALFRGRYAPDFESMDPEARVDLPCRYMIPTWHPAFLLRQPEGNQRKTAAGQFLVNASLAHLEKAKRLLTEDAKWSYRYHVVPDHLVRDVAHLAENSPERLDAEARAEADSIYSFMLNVSALKNGQLATSTDIETDNKDPWRVTDIRCIGFHPVYPTDQQTQQARALVVNTTGRRRGDPLVDAICSWLEDPNAIKCFQNGIYDIQVIWSIWQCDVQGYRLDSLVAHNAVHSDEPHNLQHIACVYTDTPAWKPPKTQGEQQVWESPEQLHKYNGRDVYNTSLAIRHQLAEMDAEKVTVQGKSTGARFVHDLDVAMFHCARDMERAGFPISPERWNKWAARSDFYAARAMGLMGSFLGKTDFNPRSPPQLQWALYDQNGPCRFTPSRYTDPSVTHPQGQPSTDKAALLTFRGHPFIDLLLDFRRWTGIRSNYIEGMNLGTDWRLRFRWKPLGARTGRWSTEDGNAQNWFKQMKLLLALFEGISSAGKPFGGPHRLQLFPGDEQYVAKDDRTTVDIPGIREVVVVPPGRKIVGADLSQAELRVLGALSGDEKLISLCVNADEERKLEPEWDPHSYVCGFAFKDGFLKADTKTKKILRDLEKRVIYGSFYGAGADTIWQSIYDGGYEGPPIDVEMVEHILAAIFKAFPNVRPWRENAMREAKKTGKVTDALIGRRREFPLLLIDPTVVYNFAIQSTTASIMNMSMWELRNRLPSVDPSAMLLAQVHDAIYVECDESRAEPVARLLEQCMSQELQLVPGAAWMPFPATAKIADDWLQAG